LPSLAMNKEELVQLGEVFRTFIVPLMDEKGTADFGLIWEFEKYLDSKREEIASAQKQVVKTWQAPLLSK
jgi:hypothetical protein